MSTPGQQVNLADLLKSTLESAGVAPQDSRDKAINTVNQFCAQRNYSVEIVSFRKKVLIVKARPAEALFLSFDKQALLQALAEAGVQVSGIRVKSYHSDN